MPVEHLNTFPDRELARKILDLIKNEQEAIRDLSDDYYVGDKLSTLMNDIETLCKKALEQDTSTTDVTAIYWKRADRSTGIFVSSNDIEIKEKLDQLLALQASNKIHDITIGTHPPIAASSSPEKDK